MARYANHLPARWRAKEKAKSAAAVKPSSDALLARTSFVHFLTYVLGKTPAHHHLVWIQHLVTGESSENLSLIAGSNLEILAPRGSAKSTIIGAFVAWTIGHNPGIRIIYTSYSESVALSRSRLIKRLIEKKEYREVFPHIQKGSRWSDTDWEINKAWAGVEDAGIESDYTFYAAGITGSITSRRSDLILYDDCVKSSKSIENPDVRQKILDNIGEVIQPTLVPGGREIDIGTRFRGDDIHATEFTVANGWHVIEQSAIITNPDTGEEESYWPERFTLPKLAHIREKKPTIFSFQYQNKVVRISDISIDPDWIDRGAVPLDLYQYDSLVIGLDLSSKQRESNDYTVFTLAGRIGQNFYALDMRRGRWAGNGDKLAVLIEMCLDWGIIDEDETVDEDKRGRYIAQPLTVYFHAEDSSYQASLGADFKRFITQRHAIYNLVYVPAKTNRATGDKLCRLRGVTGIFQNHLLTFSNYRNFGIMVDELINFGSAEHDDCVDSLVFALTLLAARARLDVA